MENMENDVRVSLLTSLQHPGSSMPGSSALLSSLLPHSSAVLLRGRRLAGGCQLSRGARTGQGGRRLLGSCPSASPSVWGSFPFLEPSQALCFSKVGVYALVRCSIGDACGSIFFMKIKNRFCARLFFSFLSWEFADSLLFYSGLRQ